MVDLTPTPASVPDQLPAGGLIISCSEALVPDMLKKLLRHSRLLLSAVAGFVLFFLLPESWTTLTRILVSWNFGAVLFLVLVVHYMTALSATQFCERYKEEDETAPVILIIGILGAVLAVASIVAFLSQTTRTSPVYSSLYITLAAATVMTAWILIPTMFTLHYSDLYYRARSGDRPLKFPDTKLPLFWDFAYFSFTIAAACQTADVSTAQGSIRKIVVAHSVLSFFFNASILGFAINVTAGLIGNQ
jgi:uncharacterized membrane protein